MTYRPRDGVSRCRSGACRSNNDRSFREVIAAADFHGSGSTVRHGDTAFLLAIRNSVRSKGRLALTLGLLATAEPLFMTSINVRSAWQRNLTEASAERHFDLELQFARGQAEAAVLATVSAVPGVRRVEPWSIAAASRARGDGLRIDRTYPDGGHGSLQLQAVPHDSAFLTPTTIAGHWLDALDSGEAALQRAGAIDVPCAADR